MYSQASASYLRVTRLAVLRRLDIIGIDFSQRDALRCFAWSIMAVADDSTARGRLHANVLLVMHIR